MKMRPAQVLELVVNLLLPWVTYRLAQPYWGETGGLIASAAPPVIWSVIELVRFRRVDALALMVLLGIVLSIGAMALGGDSRVLLMRESLVSGAIGAAFLLSLLLRRPIIFYLTRAFVAREMTNGAAHVDMLWRERPAFARALRVLTVTWGVGLITETSLRIWMAWHWPIERVLVVSPVVGYGIFGGLMVWTFWYRRTMRDLVGQAPESEAQASRGTAAN
ncbi:VC0807 family protein [Paraburkholderia phymatum]|uniref:VC0807 family protein n=1 Tax=Paraburkholderia phymatum TaxID=148447 RepID=UPI00316EDB85